MRPCKYPYIILIIASSWRLAIKPRRKHAISCIKMFLQIPWHRYALQIGSQVYCSSLISSNKCSNVFTCKLSVLQYKLNRKKFAPGMPGTFSLPPRISDPDMHHGDCVTHVLWCMPGLLTSGFHLKLVSGKTFSVILAHAQTWNFMYLVRVLWEDVRSTQLSK